MRGKRAEIVLREVAVQHVFRELAGPAQRLDPVAPGDRLDARSHTARRFPLPEDDVADEIRRRKRGDWQPQQLMAGFNPARMARLFRRDAICQAEERNLVRSFVVRQIEVAEETMSE